MRLNSLWTLRARVIGRRGRTRQRVHLTALAVELPERVVDRCVGSPRGLGLGDRAGELAHAAHPLAPLESSLELGDAGARVLGRPLLDEQRRQQAAGRLVLQV